MSYDTERTFLYYLHGRDIHLYQLIGSARTDTLAGYRIRLPDEYVGNQLSYPQESITDGLMFEGTAFIKPFITLDPNELTGDDNPDFIADESPSEDSHVNLSRMLSLAVVDYVKSQKAVVAGNFEVKEYFVKEFWKKVGDNESNKRKSVISFTHQPFAVK